VTDLNAELPAHVTLLQQTLGESISISAVLAPGLWSAQVDPAQVMDVLLNLAINARDAMPQGGLLTIRTENVTLDPSYSNTHVDVVPGDYVVMSVTDTGTGMRPEVLARATEPFFSTKDPDDGTGLGLSMCFGFAKQSGGHLAIYSEVGVGTTVRLYLPRADAGAAAEPATETEQSPPGGAREVILLVEDNDEMRRMATRSLTTLGYEVHVAADGTAALAALRTAGPVDLLFTDVVMPGGLNGYQLAEAARELVPGLRVLFTTGFAQLGDGDTAAYGAEVLHKPYRREELAQRVRTVLATG
jgi:two-component system CheB/CheR fusion protein